ncbi:uncharacterized protein CTRU02_208815 [Colletotrichum truncatum]|uniref:Uncharacterized protein n=1 Tax=Colletotrichum truncatum TaxID=5467 RepID=A0ACC3YXF1_COLTU|nr:uncharacterized protein CTRU02_06527 [Colletotrichum truncatum]KAF6792444.1 hypothetical protein CTRU02_06527 [Colletotrichum truncatum]
MPRFSVAFGRRRSTVTSEDFQNGAVAMGDQQQQSSFRVLERTEVGGNKSFDGGHRLLKAATTAIPPKHNYTDLSTEDNMFADVKNNRGSGSSNTTKTTSTDTSSRHSNVSTTPSSADLGAQGPQEEWRNSIKKSHTDVPPPKHSSGGFLSKAGRTFSFGGQKKNQASVSSVDDHPLPLPPLPTQALEDDSSRRPRGLTASTASTATPPKLSEEDFALNFGSDFGNMFKGSGFDKRASQMTLPGNDKSNLGPRSLTTNRVNQPQPSPIKIDKSIKVESSPYSWSSQHSNDNLLHDNLFQPGPGSPTNNTDRTSVPPPVPRHGSPLAFRNNVPSDIIEDEDANLLKDSLAASRFLGHSSQPSNPSPPGRFRRNEDTFSTGWDATDSKKEEENMFDNTSARPPPSKPSNHSTSNSNSSPPRNKVMTPAEFEKYRKDKERRDSASETAKASNGSRDDDEDQYEDDEDDVEKAKLAAKQRRKQEAHMAVYRQQMMKVTGEQPNLPSEHAPRPSLSMSLSTPNLAVPPGPLTGRSEGSEEEDEEVPLAILAAHGFPNKNKPPNRLMNMASNPDLRSSVQSQPQRPGSSMGEGTGPRGTSGGHLPAFARKLPQDPFLGAGLINAPPRESLTFGGGSPAPGVAPAVPMGGLVGVIASEERSRAMRRGSPNIEAQNVNPFTGAPVDPNAGIPPQMMYSNMNGLNGMNGGMNNGMNGMNGGMGQMGMGGMGGMPQMHQMPQMPQMPPQIPQMMLTPGDQAQIQMTQQMQQFMQMQMQFMQMMATPNQNMNNGMPRPLSHIATPSIHDSQRQSFFGDSMLEPPRLDPRSRTMSMVQPSSASWIQPGGGYTPSIHGGLGGGGAGYTPSIHAQGAGYAPSIAPSERSNIGLPGRYRPVTHASQPLDTGRRMSVMSSAMGWEEPPKVMQQENKTTVQKNSGNNSDDDDEEGWAAMKAKKEKKRSLWKTKKSIGSEIGALIS